MEAHGHSSHGIWSPRDDLVSRHGAARVGTRPATCHEFTRPFLSPNQQMAYVNILVKYSAADKKEVHIIRMKNDRVTKIEH